jgi:S-adenosylmethionine hydrolase
VGRGDALALVGSSGYLELSVNQGSLAARIGAQIGDRVEVQIG